MHKSLLVAARYMYQGGTTVDDIARALSVPRGEVATAVASGRWDRNTRPPTPEPRHNILWDMREKKGVTQVEMAKRLGVTQSSLSHVESADVTPTFERTVRYVRALGGSVRVVAEIDGQPVEVSL